MEYSLKCKDLQFFYFNINWIFIFVSYNLIQLHSPNLIDPHHICAAIYIRYLEFSFTALYSFNISQSPREYTEHERRQLLIARLPNVETLNGGGVISSQEREDAERAFIRYYMDKPEADRPER